MLVTGIIYDQHCTKWIYQYQCFQNYIAILTRRHCLSSTVLYRAQWNENNLKRSCYWQNFNYMDDRDDNSAWNAQPSASETAGEDEWWALNREREMNQWGLEYNTYYIDYVWTSGKVMAEATSNEKESKTEEEKENKTETNVNEEKSNENDDIEIEVGQENEANTAPANENDESSTMALSASVAPNESEKGKAQSVDLSQLNEQDRTHSSRLSSQENVSSVQDNSQQQEVAAPRKDNTNKNDDSNEQSSQQQEHKHDSNSNSKSRTLGPICGKEVEGGFIDMSNNYVKILLSKARFEVPQTWEQSGLNHMWRWDHENKTFDAFQSHAQLIVGENGEYTQVTPGQTVYFRSSKPGARTAYIIDKIGESDNDRCGAAMWTVHNSEDQDDSIEALSNNFSKISSPRMYI